MYKDNIIKRIDLSDLANEIVPLGISGRIQFFNAYFGKYEAECVAYLVLQTIVSCKKFGNNDIVIKFVKYYKENEEMHKYFQKSMRIRPIIDYCAVKKFNKIIKMY